MDADDRFMRKDYGRFINMLEAARQGFESGAGPMIWIYDTKQQAQSTRTKIYHGRRQHKILNEPKVKDDSEYVKPTEDELVNSLLAAEEHIASGGEERDQEEYTKYDNLGFTIRPHKGKYLLQSFLLAETDKGMTLKEYSK